MNLVVLIMTGLAALAILGGVVLLVMGRGGGLARFEADYPPLDLPSERPVTGADVSHLRLPLALWGYHVRAVDEVFYRIMRALSDRDHRIAVLERTIVELGGVSALRRALEETGEAAVRPPRDAPDSLLADAAADPDGPGER